MNLTVFNHGKTAIDLDEVRMINGSAIIFKNDLKVYDIGEEAADAVHQMLNSSSREPQPTPRDKSPTPQPSDPSQPYTTPPPLPLLSTSPQTPLQNDENPLQNAPRPKDGQRAVPTLKTP